jgi:hypothetical protein
LESAHFQQAVIVEVASFSLQVVIAGFSFAPVDVHDYRWTVAVGVRLEPSIRKHQRNEARVKLDQALPP